MTREFKKSFAAIATLVVMLFLNACANSGAVTTSTAAGANQLQAVGPEQRPKLIVGIVVDQMRYDYLFRYWSKYGEGGFKKLVTQGFSFKNNQYSYVPTYTGPGHASVYTGSVPAINGIIGNNWYDRRTGKSVYCVEDNTVKTVGSSSTAGEMSPDNLLTTTVTDELRLATNKASKVIGIALKDRGSILPAGHMANAAYWFDSPTGNWITSTYYMQELPSWVKEFNQQKFPDQYLSQAWNTLLPIEQYTESSADDEEWERPLGGKARATFPYDVPALRGKDYELIRSIPAGNSITKDFALAALEHEKLGQGASTDFLALSFSSPDYAGHSFGPNSIEVEDMYLRLDKDIEEIINQLEKTIGKENVLIFLTADHGAAQVPAYMLSNKIPAGLANSSAMRDSIEQHLDKFFGAGKWVEQYTNQQVYLNRNLINTKKLSHEEVQEQVVNVILRFENVMKAVTAESLKRSGWGKGLMTRIDNGYNTQRSGDVIVVYQPGWFEGGRQGTTHGSYSNYDTHVPLVWYGWKVKPGESAAEVEIADIAPTIASWLYIQEPNGSVGRPLQEFMK
ncbi:alkaline phosphatase PafA [Pontibacter harenae]|uniref:alkaline phosphatase PafA n=1 Tax=Pontibacter harenae TaxID=2894083 RepID=UPI001E2D48D9|nr:alkaline phosphatase PafA [Pontibacter harenae]MCC9168442.1 alkaline phosphatase family protein [Pontibacter harenae]